MLRLLSTNLRNSLRERFYPIAIGGVLVTLFAVQVYLPTQFAIFGLYALFGLVGGAAIYHGTTEVSEQLRPPTDTRLYRNSVYITSTVALGVVSLTNEPRLVVVGLGMGYALVVHQLFANPTPERLIPQLTALYLLSPATKYLTAGRYIGHGDIFPHTRIVEDLLVGRSLEAISYTSYYDFPGLHLLAATIGSLSGLGPYDGIMLTGLAAFALLIPAVYVITIRVTNDQMLALSTAFAITVLSDLSFFASYVFPQSLATVLIVLLAVLASMASRDAIKWRVAGAFGVVTVTLATTHHLTQVLFVPVVLCLCLFYVLNGTEYARPLLSSRYLALFGFAVVVNGVRLWQTSFLERLLANAVLLVQGGLFGGYSAGVTLGFGTAPRSASITSALDWLASPYAIYLVLLLMVFSIGIVGFLQASWRPAVHTAVALTGILGAVLVFDSPLSIKSLIRIRMPWLFVFAFVVGIGLQQFRRYVGPIGGRQLLLAILVVLATVTPLVTADNFYGLDPRPTAQTSFSDEEYSELRATKSFVAESEEPTTVFWQTRLVMDRFEVTGLQRATLRERSLVLPSGHFVYRSAWTDHKVTFTVRSGDSLYANNLYISERWLSRRVEAGNKVYTAGGTGVLWNRTERSFGNESR